MSSTKQQQGGGKGKGKESKATAGGNNNEEEEVLQAIVIADSFDVRFQPLTTELPRCLLPLCNVPLIEYTFEMLVLSSVQEVFVLTCAHSDQVRKYIKGSKWGKASSSLKVQVIVAQQLLSVGDALRELDAKSVIRSDFILLFGDTVSNVKLQEAVAAHKERRKVNKDALMTMVVQEASVNHPSRQPEINPIYILDADTKECVYYEPFETLPRPSELVIPAEALAKVSKRAELELRKDLLDCFIDICSVEVPALFTENFDYQDLRSDFVHGVLTSDLLGKSIHCHILDKTYSARVSGPKMYDAVSRDVLGRWAYPLVPDANLGNTTFTYSRRQIYKEAGVAPAQSCVLERRLAIGSETTLGADSLLRDSVIGRNCRIGANVLLDKAYLFDDVVIGDNCKIYNAIIGSSSQILDGVTINQGTIIANHCVIGPDTVVPPFTKITATLPSPDSDEDSEEESEKSEIKSAKGTKFGEKAFEWTDTFSDCSDDEDYSQKNYLLTQLAHVSELPPISSDELTDEEVDGSEDGSDAELDKEEARALEFEREAKMTVERALKEGLTVDNALLELTALRMSYNAQFIQVREVVIPQLLHILDFSKPLASALKSLLATWAPLIAKFTLSEYDMIDAIDILMASCADLDAKHATKLFTLGLSQLYDLDILAEDAILRWYEVNEPDRLVDRMSDYNRLRDSVKPFIDWLDEAEEDSD